MGQILTSFLDGDIEKVAGTRDEWETVLAELTRLLSDFSDCRIPLQMMSSLILYVKSGDHKHLLALPREQRSLLEERLAEYKENS